MAPTRRISYSDVSDNTCRTAPGSLLRIGHQGGREVSQGGDWDDVAAGQAPKPARTLTAAGLVEFEGAKANNLLPIRLDGVFKDPNSSEDTRYKSARHGKFASIEQSEACRKKHTWTVMAEEMDVGKVHAIVSTELESEA